MGEEVKLFTTWSSPYGLRVIWALNLKGIQYQTLDENILQKSSSLLKYNPVYKKVPVLVHNGKPISESLFILEYLDETWKDQYLLLPQHPHDRARARFWAKFGDDKVLQTIAFGIVGKEGKEQEEAVCEARENLKYVEEELKGNKFFGGDQIGIVDLALGWLGYYIAVFEEVVGFKIIDQQKFPFLTEWMKEFASLPFIKETWPPFRKLVARFVEFRKSHLLKAKSNI
ncbi:probable glutathione S-transferase [Euphorbia lathyris]|uniref:probable glutathione S-transferase n=1 Tax=Euphorbia lathyris TaxID=212925 RepID=UPI003313E816